MTEVKIKKNIFNVLILAGAIILSIFCGEFMVRLKSTLYCLGYKSSLNDRIVYELYPGYTIRSLKAKISPQGLNDRCFSVVKPLDAFRIAVVGDSTSFGWKVGPEKSFPKVLEGILNEGRKKKFEVINFSVPGYNTSQEYEILKEKVLKFNPDMVILVFYENDTYFCPYFKPKVTFLNYLYNKSYFFHLLLRRMDTLITYHVRASFISKSWSAFKKNILGMYYYSRLIYPYPGLEETICIDRNPPASPKDVPSRYWYMLGYENYRIHLASIQRLLKSNNIQFVSAGFFTPEAYHINEELEIRYICDFNKRLNRAGIEYHEFCLSPADNHLNIEGHHLIAESIYKFLSEKKLL